MARVPVRITCAVLAALALSGAGAGSAAAAPGAADLCRGGAKLIAAGDPARAYDTLAAAARLPGGECADRLLRTARREHAAALCRRAAVLKKAGEKKAATALYRRSLAVRPDAGGCAHAALTPAAKKDEPFLVDARDAVADALAWAWKNLAWIALALFLLYLAALLLAHDPRWHRRIAGRWPFEPVLRSRLQVAPFGDGGLGQSVGAGVSALVRGRLANLGSGRRLRLDFVIAHETLADTFKGIGELSPRLKVVEAVLGAVDRLLPVNRLTVGGELLPTSAGRGAGVALTLHRREGLGAAGELWERPRSSPVVATTADDATGHLRLVVPATAWAEVELARALGQRDLKLPTCDAISHARAMAGGRWLREGDLALARLAFEDALDADPGNWMAWGNLANVEAAGAHWVLAVLHGLRACEEFERRGAVEPGGPSCA